MGHGHDTEDPTLRPALVLLEWIPCEEDSNLLRYIERPATLLEASVHCDVKAPELLLRGILGRRSRCHEGDDIVRICAMQAILVGAPLDAGEPLLDNRKPGYCSEHFGSPIHGLYLEDFGAYLPQLP